MVMLALQKPGAHNLFTIVRPNTGEGESGASPSLGWVGQAEWGRQLRLPACRLDS